MRRVGGAAALVVMMSMAHVCAALGPGPTLLWGVGVHRPQVGPARGAHGARARLWAPGRAPRAPPLTRCWCPPALLPPLRAAPQSAPAHDAARDAPVVVAQGGAPLPPARALAFGRGQPIGPPGEQSGAGPKLTLPKRLPGGSLAEALGTTDIPVDVMAMFGGLGFLWGHARAKLGERAASACAARRRGGVAAWRRGGWAG